MKQVINIYFTLCFFVVLPVYAQMNQQVNSQTDFWKQAGLSNHDIFSITTNSHGHIFTGTGDSGVYRSTDRGENWINVKNYPARVEALAVNSNDFIFAGPSNSTDYGESWSDMDFRNDYVFSICAAPNGDLFTGVLDFEDYIGGLIYHSMDNGDHWTNINNGLDSTLSLSIFQHSSGNLFVGSIWIDVYVDKPPPNQWFFYGGLRSSTDNGRTWLTLDGLYNYTVSSLKEDRQGWIFAGTYGNGMYRSIDTGATWTEINEGLSTWHQRNVRSFIIKSDGDLFIATLGGVFESTDNGDHWIAMNTGLTDTTVSCITIDPLGYLYIGTNKGVFRSVQSTTSFENQSKEHVSVLYLKQNYPNPFNPSTTIEFSLPHAEYMTLRVYDILGVEVSVLVNEHLHAGVHRVSWNAWSRASGFYLVRLQAGRSTQTRKLLLMK
ncbi:MAG: T9SS type A sorting domain-containing protein [Bacteroidota bacterium]|nr:T9SS type A sorting domain-containing protein [Bacteroidota bacterium]